MTYAKVMTAAQELGYQFNDLARGLLENGSRLVGLVVTQPEVGLRCQSGGSALSGAYLARFYSGGDQHRAHSWCDGGSTFNFVRLSR
ncbi:MAG: hypothetical protein ACSLEN_01975 [Candidatus Malihini olakiniferum]